MTSMNNASAMPTTANQRLNTPELAATSGVPEVKKVKAFKKGEAIDWTILLSNPVIALISTSTRPFDTGLGFIALSDGKGLDIGAEP